MSFDRDSRHIRCRTLSMRCVSRAALGMDGFRRYSGPTIEEAEEFYRRLVTRVSVIYVSGMTVIAGRPF